MRPGSRGIAGLILPLLVMALLTIPPGPAEMPGREPVVLSGRLHLALAAPVRPAPAATEYVNLTDLSSNWTSDFYGVHWPGGTFSAIRMVMVLSNFGDPWDRADWVALDNVTLMDLTTLENGSGNNPVQVYSSNVTEYERLFAGPGHVWWQAMPDWIAACDVGSPGCWSGVLSFQFTPGPAREGLPTVAPVTPFATLTAAAPAFNGTIRISGSYSRAEAVIFQEGQGTDEFWYVQAFAARELLWQWDNQTVLAVLPIPFINSGGALGGVDDLAEWNGTPAPGTGPRPAVTADLTPWVGLLNRTPWYNFTVVDNANSWQIGLALFLWNATDLRNVSLAGDTVNRTLTARTAAVVGHAASVISEPFGAESYSTNWSEYLNTSGTTIDLATARTIVDRVVSPSLSVLKVAVRRTVFDVRVDASGAVHILDLANWTNTTRVSGNGQDANLSEAGSVAWVIDGASAGLSSVERREATETSAGNYSAPATGFASSWALFNNRTSKNGVGTSAAPVLLRVGGSPVPIPGIFVVAPVAGSVVRGRVEVKLLVSPDCVGAGTVAFGNVTVQTPTNDTVWVNDPSNPNGTYDLNVTAPTWTGLPELEVPLRVTGWEPAYVAPLTASASAAVLVGEAPWTASFNGSVTGGTPPYSYRWEFGDGGTALALGPTHSYLQPGNFEATLNVTDSKGRTSTSSVGVQVFPALATSLVSSLSDWTVGTPASVVAQVEGGLGPMNFSWDPLPAGCVDASPSSVTCTPSGTGVVALEVLVTDSLGYASMAWLNSSVSARPSPQGPGQLDLLIAGGIVGGVVALSLVAFRLRGRQRRTP